MLHYQYVCQAMITYRILERLLHKEICARMQASINNSIILVVLDIVQQQIGLVGQCSHRRLKVPGLIPYLTVSM